MKMNLRRWVLVCGGVMLLSLLEMGPTARTQAQGQSDANGRTPTIEEYQPKSTLVTTEHKPERAKYPFVDIHSHHWNPTAEYVDKLVKEMNTINLRVLVNLSGGTGDSLKKTLAVMKG